jgi:hypothetical protein
MKTARRLKTWVFIGSCLLIWVTVNIFTTRHILRQMLIFPSSARIA